MEELTGEEKNHINMKATALWLLKMVFKFIIMLIAFSSLRLLYLLKTAYVFVCYNSIY